MNYELRIKNYEFSPLNLLRWSSKIWQLRLAEAQPLATAIRKIKSRL
jgi:hypothetical protein